LPAPWNTPVRTSTLRQGPPAAFAPRTSLAGLSLRRVPLVLEQACRRRLPGLDTSRILLTPRARPTATHSSPNASTPGPAHPRASTTVSARPARTRRRRCAAAPRPAAPAGAAACAPRTRRRAGWACRGAGPAARARRSRARTASAAAAGTRPGRSAAGCTRPCSKSLRGAPPVGPGAAGIGMARGAARACQRGKVHGGQQALCRHASCHGSQARRMQGAGARSLPPGGARRGPHRRRTKVAVVQPHGLRRLVRRGHRLAPAQHVAARPAPGAAHLRSDAPLARASAHMAQRSACMPCGPSARCVQQAVRAPSAAAQQGSHGGALTPVLPHAFPRPTHCMAGQPAGTHARRQAARHPQPARQALPAHAQRRRARAPGRA